MRLSVKRADEIELNLISLVDVVLLLVIFFMLSTSFVQDTHLRITLPEAGAASTERAANAIVVTVSAQGSYRVNGRALVNNERRCARSPAMPASFRSRSARMHARRTSPS
jgi:biopolymer transport protein ExbD